MRSKFLLIVVVFTSLAACTPKTIPDEQAAIRDDVARDQVVETVTQQGEIPDTNRYSDAHLAIAEQIEQGQWTEALQELEGRIYGPGSLDKVTYISPAYGAYLELYVQLGKQIVDQGNGEQKQLWAVSEEQFEERFLSECLGTEQSICEMLEQVLRHEASTLWIVLNIADSKEGNIEKLNVLGAAYDVQNRRGSEKLEQEYMKVALLVLADVEEGRTQLAMETQRIHLNNIVALTVQNKWNRPNADKMAWFELIKPWEYDSDANTALSAVRKQLVPFLPVYSRISPAVKEGIKEQVAKRLERIKTGRKDLSQYPAYANIQIDSLLSGPIEVAYLALEMYFQNVPVTDASSYVSSIEHKAAFVDEMFEASKMLVRWDIAQLGIESTEKLHDRLSEQDAVTNAHFQEVLDWSKTLIPVWTEFHTVRLWSVKTFIESNIRYSHKYDEIKTQEFFTSVNRNILRAVTYPNMMAFAFNMMKTEWAATIRILWFQFKLDSTLIMDYMMTGQYYGPWFNFTNLQEEKSWWDEEKKTLYRSDMYDALYYMFTTRTAEIYGITADKFIAATAETLIKQRRSQYEYTLEAQKQIYFNESSEGSKMVRWCDGIRSQQPEPENIPFYELNSYITPNIVNMGFDEVNGKESFYWGDYYKESKNFERLHQTNDRYRLELEPIYYTLNQYLEIAERAKEAHPELNIGTLEEARGEIKQIEHFKMTYLGVQKAIMEKVDDCLFVAEKEAKRRIREQAFAQHEYFSKVVHPLMLAVKEGTLSIADANQVIQDFHGNIPGVLDAIDASEAGDPVYSLSQVTYMLRTKKFLTESVNFQSPYTEPVNVPAIVGDYLEIAIPPKFLEDPSNNPYISQNSTIDNFRTLKFGEDVDEFSKAATKLTTDDSRFAILGSRFTQWDQYELRKYAWEFRYVVEQQAIFLQIPVQRFYDINKPNCWVTQYEELGDDCVREETPSMDTLVDTMGNVLQSYVLSEEDQAYFNLTGFQGWVGSEALDTAIEFDMSLDINWMSETLPYTRLAGLMDLPYQLLDADVLGLTFQTNWDIKRNEGNDRPMDNSCAGMRDGCYWVWERQQAKQFFWARGKRPGMMFNYDYKIVENDFKRMKDIVFPKFERLLEVEKNAQNFAEAVIKENNYPDLVSINIYMEPVEVYGLNVNYKNSAREYEKFFDEVTEGFFNREHNWEAELKIQ